MSINPFAFNKIFQGVLQFANEKYGENEYSVKSYSIDSPCSLGDNFLSDIYAINVDVQLNSPKNCQDRELQHDDLICKSQIISANGQTDVQRYVHNLIFIKEKLCYEDIMPRMASLLNDIPSIGHERSDLAPKLHTFYTEGDTYSCMLMDNLNSLGYYTPNTHGSGMTLEECKSIMRAMARFHALSLVMEGQDQIPIPQKHQICAAEFFFTEQVASTMISIVEESFFGIIQLAEKYQPELVPFLTELHQEERVWERLSNLVKPGNTSFSCFCHGDARVNNIFVNREDPSMVRFIDFQLTRYASPLTDLQYVLKIGTTKEFRREHTNTVLKVYHEEFTTILASFSPAVKLLSEKEAAVTGWTLETLIKEYEEMSMYGFLIATTFLPVILLRPGDINKSVGQMSKEERETFWKFGRKEMVFDMGCKHADVRKRLLDICEEQAVFLRQ